MISEKMRNILIIFTLIGLAGLLSACAGLPPLPPNASDPESRLAGHSQPALSTQRRRKGVESLTGTLGNTPPLPAGCSFAYNTSLPTDDDDDTSQIYTWPQALHVYS